MKKQPLKEMFKKIGGHKLNESTWDNRKFGEPLPTMADYKKAHTKRYQEKLNEVDYEKVVVPAQVKRWMAKFVNAVKEANLNKMKRIAILFAVIKALGISKQELQQYMMKVKREV